MSDRGTSLRSNQWSCSELMKGAEICADLAGLALKVDPSKLSREQLLQSIQELFCDICMNLYKQSHTLCIK